MYQSIYFDTKYQLLNSAPNRTGMDENAPLYSMELVIVDPQFKVLVNRLDSFWSQCHAGRSGLYHQRPYKDGSKSDYISPDQLIALVAFFAKKGNKREIKRIWRYLKSHYFTYNNLTGKTDFSRMMQPMAIAFTGAAAGSWFWKRVLVQICRKSCKEFDKRHSNWRTQSSGVLKSLVVLRSLGIKDHICEDYYEAARAVYYPTYHPLNPGYRL